MSLASDFEVIHISEPLPTPSIVQLLVHLAKNEFGYHERRVRSNGDSEGLLVLPISHQHVEVVSHQFFRLTLLLGFLLRVQCPRNAVGVDGMVEAADIGLNDVA